MKEIIEYIMVNYTWFLGGLIIILLAIIGYYAEKTNFGQPKTNKQKSENINVDNKLEGKLLSDLVNGEQPIQNESNNQILETQQNIGNVDQNLESLYEQQNDSVEEVKTESETKILEDQNLDKDNKFEDFDKEFNEVLPEKSLLDEELLNDIDNLTFDKPQKINVDVDQNFDDVELPKIKTFEPETNDVWKF